MSKAQVSNTISRFDTILFIDQSYCFDDSINIISDIAIITQSDGLPVSYSYNNNCIFIDSPTPDSFKVSLRTYPKFIADTISRTYTNPLYYVENWKPQKSNDNQASLISNDIQYKGSFDRSISAGNSQSAVLNSNLNLQLEGKLTNDLSIRGVIYDSNIPIQVDGTTQEINDIDRLFIEASRENTHLTLGDMYIQSQPNYFLKYNKKVKGIKVVNRTGDNNKMLSTSASFALFGGKFTRKELKTNEGNQGPYKLTGNNNEQFIIIQSGSERVYSNGALLERGLNKAYTIDYNRAEITFTGNEIITKDSRIVIEYEYLTQNFSRLISSGEASWKNNNNTLSFQFYSENDNKNSVSNYNLNNEDKKALSVAGDDITQYVRTGIFKNDNFSEEHTFYELAVSGQDTILEYSTDREKAQYQAYFSFVDENNGDYVIDTSIVVNGRVYKYVGKNQGNYSPVKKLVAPEKKQLFTLAQKFNKNGLTVENNFALSQKDINTFSKKDNNDNWGIALNSNLTKEIKFKKLKWTNGITSELKSITFNSINPYRPTEFSRDWNLSSKELSKEFLLGYFSDISYKRFKFRYDLNLFKRSQTYDGLKNSFYINTYFKGWSLNASNSWLKTTQENESTSFVRPNIKLAKNIGSWTISSNYESELNYRNEFDSIKDDSYKFHSVKYSIDYKKKDTLFSIYNITRWDISPQNGDWSMQAKANTVGSSLNWNLKQQAINVQFNYRKLTRSLESDENNLQGKGYYKYQLFKNQLQVRHELECSSGQEPKIEYDYRKVRKGQGQYIWVDNGDNIQQKQEFQVSPFVDQGEFIRVRLFNNEFVPIFRQKTSHSINLSLKEFFKKKNRIHSLLSKTSFLLNHKLDRRISHPVNIRTFITPNETRASRTSHSFRVYWNRGNPNWEIISEWIKSSNKLLETTGTLDNQLDTKSIQLRKGFSNKTSLILKSSINTKKNTHTIFKDSDYAIVEKKQLIRLQIPLKKTLIFEIEGFISNGQNILGDQDTKHFGSNVKATYLFNKGVRFEGFFNYKKINFSGENSETVKFALLNGLQNGNNSIWSLKISKRVFKSFDIFLNYDGRKIGEQKIIHRGTIQLRTNF